MAITNVVASGTTAASSADIAIAAGSIYTFMLNPASGGVQTDMSGQVYQNTTTGYIYFGGMDKSAPNCHARGPIVVQLRRQSGSVIAFGIDQDA